MSLSKELIARIEKQYTEHIDDSYYPPMNLVRWIPVLIQEIRLLEGEMAKMRGVDDPAS